MFLLYILYIREIWKNLDERGFKPTTFALGMHESNQPICHIKQIPHEAQPTIRIPLFQILHEKKEPVLNNEFHTNSAERIVTRSTFFLIINYQTHFTKNFIEKIV